MHSVGEVPEAIRTPLTLDWPTDGTVLLGGQGGIWTMPVAGGSGTPLVQTDRQRGEISAYSAAWLPGGQRIVYGVRRLDGVRVVDEIRVLTVATGEQRAVVQNGRRPWYVSTGHLLYQQGTQPPVVFAAAFDAERWVRQGRRRRRVHK